MASRSGIGKGRQLLRPSPASEHNGPPDEVPPPLYAAKSGTVHTNVHTPLGAAFMPHHHTPGPAELDKCLSSSRASQSVSHVKSECAQHACLDNLSPAQHMSPSLQPHLCSSLW